MMALALATLVVLGACGNVLAPPAAVVDGHKISTQTITTTLRQLEASSQFKQAAQRSSGKAVARQLEQSYLARLIRRYILNLKARQLGVTVSAAELQRALDQIQKNYPNKAAFLKAIQQQGLTLARLRPLVRDGVLERRLRARVTASISSPGAREKAWQKWLIAAYKAARVNVNPRYGTLDLSTQTIVDNAGAFPGAATPSPSPTPAVSPSG
jgi:parvulin-like peptidyl-prolyl isomerase